MRISQEYFKDVCVIGGGPAGAACALKLANLGHQVCLVEADRFPRRKIGESLSEGTVSVLAQLGVLEQVEEAAFFRPRSAYISWAGLNGKKTVVSERPGFQVDRGGFDEILLEQARDAGVTIIQPARAAQPQQLVSGWRIPVAHTSGPIAIESKHLVVATGSKRFNQLERLRLTPHLLATYGWWSQCPPCGTESRIEAISDGWIWGAPIPGGLFCAAVFTDPKSKQHSNKQNAEDFYISKLRNSKLLKFCTDGTLSGNLTTCNATSYLTKDLVANNRIYVGDAALTLDPLSSQGVQTALKSGLLAAQVVHSKLIMPEKQTLADEFYRSKITDIALNHARITSKFYAEQAVSFNSFFWEQRKSISNLAEEPVSRLPHAEADRLICNSSPLKLSDEVIFIDHPVLVGNLIESRIALTNSILNRPIAFIQDIEIAPLVQGVRHGDDAKDLIATWGKKIGFNSSRLLLHWLIQSKILCAI